jgi:conjugal transfer mating pair stabilization protein TraG
MPVTIYTTGGGPYIVMVFDAVAAWTRGGGYLSFLEAISLMSFLYAIVLTTFNISFMALWRWFLASTFVYSVLMVPTESVMVVDPVNPNFGQQVVANVPLGLAEMAGVSSQIGQWLTTNAEALFNVPNNQQYNQNGLIYGARLMDEVQSAQIDRAGLSYDVDSYIRNCVFYDVLFSNTQLSTIANSTNVWAALASTNVALQTNVMPLDGDGNNTGPGKLESCQQAYQEISGYWTSYLNNYSFRIAGMSFPFLSSNLQQSNQLAQAKLMTDLPAIYSSVTNNSASATDILQQALATNAFIAARANAAGSPNTSSTDAFAQARADVQAGYTYNTIADGARKWVPILNIVLTTVFYAMFPVIFPLFLLPETGLSVLKGYFTGFFYLAAWGPLYAVLNMIAVTRFTTGGLAAANGGMTLGNAAALQAVSADVSEVAGYMLAFVPFIAAGMARGATAIGSSATSFLAPSQNAAEAAAGEAATGNYSYGNVNLQNLQAQNTSTFQRQIAPSLTMGAARMTEIGTDGAVSQHYPDRDVYDYSPSFSRYPTSVSLGESLAERSDREAKVLRNEAVDLARFQRQVQDWSTSHAKAHGGSNTNVRGSSNTTSDGQRTTDSAFHGDLTANTNANSTDKVTTEFDNHDWRYTGSGTGSFSAFLGGGGGPAGTKGGGSGGRAGGSVDFTTAYNRTTGDNKAESARSLTELRSTDDSGDKHSEDTSHDLSNSLYTRVDHSTFNSWSDEQRQAYVKSLGREVRRLQSASKAYSESASSLRSNSANIDYNANRDLEGYFRDNSDLNRGFAGGGLSLLKKSRGEMTPLERMAYDKAMDDFIAREASRQAILFAQSKTHLEADYQGLKVDVK